MTGVNYGSLGFGDLPLETGEPLRTLRLFKLTEFYVYLGGEKIMKQIRLTSDPINQQKILSSGWSHNSSHFKFPRSTMEAGFKMDHKKPRSSLKDAVILIISAFVISFITAGVAIHGI